MAIGLYSHQAAPVLFFILTINHRQQLFPDVDRWKIVFIDLFVISFFKFQTSIGILFLPPNPNHPSFLFMWQSLSCSHYFYNFLVNIFSYAFKGLKDRCYKTPVVYVCERTRWDMVTLCCKTNTSLLFLLWDLVLQHKHVFWSHPKWNTFISFYRFLA